MHFNYELFLNYLIQGLANGALIALIALGYTIVYGIVELINFAHGDVFMMGAFFAFTFVSFTGVTSKNSMPLILLVLLTGLLFAMAVGGAINYTIDRVAYRRLRNAPRLAPLICAIGISFILQQLAIYWRGAIPISPPPLIPLKYRTYNVLTEIFHLDTKVRLRVLDITVFAITIPLLLLLTWFIRSTRTGKAMRATAQDRQASALMGIDVNRTISMAFVIGGLLAGAAGMIALYYNNIARAQMGFKYGLFAFTAAVLGGIGNLAGAVVGGFLIGLIWAMSDGMVKEYIPAWGAQWTNSVIFGILVIIMVFKPSGLLGDHVPEKV